GIVFIFCSNNFETIFDGVDMTHFASLKRRLVNVKFERCDKLELIEYIEYYNLKLKGSQWYYPSGKLSGILEKIRPDLSIPYYILSDTLMLSEHNMEKFVCLLND